METATPTILLRRSQERGFEDFGWTDNYLTFSFAGYRDPAWNNFGPLRVMIENHIQPRSGFPTQHISAGSRGIVHSEENVDNVVEHNYQMWLIPDRPGTTAAYHQLKYTPEECQGRFRLYVSRNGEDGSMPINTDARIWAGLFRAGDVARHPIEAGWGAWIQMVHGEVGVAGLDLRQGDGVGITDARELELQFNADSEVLLFDVRMDAPLLWR